jgi:hypothetical protein
MRGPWSGGAADHHWIPRQVAFRDGRKDTVLFMPDMYKVDLSVAAESVDHWVERVAHDPVATFNSSLLKHFPHQVRYVSAHKVPPGFGKIKKDVRGLTAQGRSAKES